MNEQMNLYDEAHWQEASEYGSGAEKKTLRDENGKETILLRLPENFHMADHTHITKRINNSSQIKIYMRVWISRIRNVKTIRKNDKSRLR